MTEMKNDLDWLIRLGLSQGKNQGTKDRLMESLQTKMQKQKRMKI